tara:strand:+ start:317 stop:442 length:126 start_codon:yes stop_codon:yes gene_type:complete
MITLSLSIHSAVTQVARLARDLWGKINDTWQNEQRNWDDII